MQPAQANRYELKFVVSAQRAVAIRDFVREFLEPDEFNGEQNWYRICSLYLDSPTLALYRQTQDGIKNRYKLRIRYYDEDPQTCAFLEVKYRISDVIRKHRATISKAGALRLLDTGQLDVADLVNPSPRSADALQHFCSRRGRLGATGTVYVSYLREAYVSTLHNRTRVTFDRDLVGFPYHPGDGLRLPDPGLRPTDDRVVLELKFTERFPDWMQELTTLFNLQRRSFPKYIKCLDAVHKQRQGMSANGSVRWCR